MLALEVLHMSDTCHHLLCAPMGSYAQSLQRSWSAWEGKTIHYRKGCGQGGISGQIDHPSSWVCCCSTRGGRLVWRNVGDLCARLQVPEWRLESLASHQGLVCSSHAGLEYCGHKLFCRHLSKMERRRMENNLWKLERKFGFNDKFLSQAWWHKPVIPTLRRQRWGDHRLFWLPDEFKACLGYMRPCLDKTTKPNQIFEIYKYLKGNLNYICSNGECIITSNTGVAM